MTKQIRQFAFDTLEKVMKEDMSRITLYYVRSCIDEGKLHKLEICEKSIRTQADLNRWQERIFISPIGYSKVYYINPDTDEPRKIEDVVKDLKKSTVSIDFCVKVLKKLGEREYLVKLFGNYLRIKSSIIFDFERNPKRFKYEWIRVLDEVDSGLVDVKEIEILNKREVLVEML